MKYMTLIPAALGAALLAACGGGSDTASSGGSPNVSLSGIAAKGLMANADVGAYPVNSDGSVGAIALATTTTDSSGRYSLTFTGAQNTPYVIKVSAKADGSTTHLDEVTNSPQALPAGFTMRALLVPTSSGAVTTTASITPFSELAVAAAAKATGGITATNAEQAISTVTQLLGFDPSNVEVKAANASGASENEKKLAIMLTAVSKLANDGALGCAGGSDGDKVKCVVDKIADSASTTSIKLETGGTDVSGALGGAVDDVLADDTLNGGVDPSTLAGVTGNLGCTENCEAAPVTAVTAITGAKALFTQLKSDWTELFSRGGASAIASGAANQEAWKFRQAMTGVQVPATSMIKDLGALLMGVDLYNDYRAGRTTLNSRTRAPGEVASDFGNAPNYAAVSCSLTQDSAGATPTTEIANANFISCRASYYAASVNGAFTDYRHGFTITPSATAGEFTYGTRARKRVTLNGTTTANDSLSGPFTGTLTTATNDAGNIVSFSVSGSLPATFKLDGNTLADHHTVWALSGTRTINGANLSTSSITGQIASYNDADAVLGTLKVNTGTVTEIPIARDALDNPVEPGSPLDAGSFGGDLDSISLDLVWTTPGAELQGVLSTQPTVWDVSGTERSPTALSFSGALRNIEGGVTTEFLQGSFDATVTGYDGYDATQPDSETNFYTTSGTFSGTIAAPTRPKLELTMSASQKSSETDVSAVNMDYKVIVGGATRTTIAITGSRDDAGKMGWTLGEATSGVTMAWTSDAARSEIRKGSDVIGVLERSSKLVTFSDRSVMSLEIGL